MHDSGSSYGYLFVSFSSSDLLACFRGVAADFIQF